MILIKITDQLAIAKYPYTLEELRADNPDVGFPDNLVGADLRPFGAAPVVPVVQPDFDPITQCITESDPTWVDGQWLQLWQVQDLPTDTVAAKQAAMAQQAREAAKAQRTAAVGRIKVTTASGRVFDGDEDSQNRMVRAIKALEATNTPSTLWVLADNTPVQVSAAELTEAMVLAGRAQSDAWVLP